VIDAKSLEHAPKSMTEMDCQCDKSEDIKESVEKITQQFLDRYRYENILGRKGESKDVDKKKCQKKQTGVRHGFRRKRVLDNTDGNSVSGVAHFPVLEKEVETDNNVSQKNKEQAETEYKYNKRVTVKFVGIALKNLTAHKDSGIAGHVST
jgi:hypothetical protein